MNEYLSEFIGKLNDPLVIFGFAGQFVFMTRFLIQWYVSEKKKRSTVPVIFWYISTVGGLMLLTYGLIDRDPVICLGQGLGVTIYLRNLWLIHARNNRISRKRQQRIEELELESDEPDPDPEESYLKSNDAAVANSTPPSAN